MVCISASAVDTDEVGTLSVSSEGLERRVMAQLASSMNYFLVRSTLNYDIRQLTDIDRAIYFTILTLHI